MIEFKDHEESWLWKKIYRRALLRYDYWDCAEIADRAVEEHRERMWVKPPITANDNIPF